MTNFSSFHLIVFFSMLFSSAGLIYAGAGSVEEDLRSLISVKAAVCVPGSSIADCLTVAGTEDEFALDSESNRRMLANTNYISYGALQRNTVPCSRRGASYYNCQPGAPANPYSRGCSAITRCRS